MIQKTKRIRKESSRQTIFFSTLAGILVLLIISFLIFSNFKISQKRSEMITKIENLKKEIQTLEEKNQELRAGITQTESEIYWEEKIRGQGYKKPGEEQVVVLPPEASEEGEREEEKGIWQKILEKIGF